MLSALTHSQIENGEDFLRSLFDNIKRAFETTSAKIDPKIDFKEKMIQLYNLIHGYETKFSKELGQKMEQVQNSIDNFKLSERVNKVCFSSPFLLFKIKTIHISVDLAKQGAQSVHFRRDLQGDSVHQKCIWAQC